MFSFSSVFFCSLITFEKFVSVDSHLDPAPFTLVIVDDFQSLLFVPQFDPFNFWLQFSRMPVFMFLLVHCFFWSFVE